MGETDLLLLGGGHAHVQILRRWMMRPVPDVRLTLVADRAEAVYSGMVPGCVAGDYPPEQAEIDLVPLARRAAARVVLARIERVDPVARRVDLEGRAPLRYDVASLDVGSSVRGLELPGVTEHVLATRPIASFLGSIEECVREKEAHGELRVAVVGGGAAGFEVATTLAARLLVAPCEAQITLLSGTPEILPRRSPQLARRARLEAERRGVEIRCDTRVVGVEKDAVLLADGERLECDLTVWATGAAPPAVVSESPLPCSPQGFVRVRDTLQVVGHDSLFAVGDCATLDAHPDLPKAGVYAVREGPVLDANLRALLAGRRLRRFSPQRRFLALLNLGDRRALGEKWGRVFAGPAAWRLKDWIDRRFMRRFRVLDSDGALAPDFPTPEEMGMEEMECGGCAAKLDARTLTRALARLPAAAEDSSVRLGLDRADDAAAWALPRGDVVLATIDAFRAFCDDPWLVGRVAAVNAASDVLAKGGRPGHALALVTLPDDEAGNAEETLFQVLSGVRAALDPLGVSLVGGHTSSGEALFVGLSISGSLPDGASALPLDGLRAGDRLLLSKALGTGVVLAADMQGRAPGRWVRAAHASMLHANGAAAEIARRFGASASTDISGFGLAGHLGEMLAASGVGAQLWLDALPALDGALPLLDRGLRSTYHAQNERAAGPLDVAEELRGDARFALLFDPQTSGGLLFSVSEENAAEALRALHDAGDRSAAEIGVVEEARADGTRLRVVPSAPTR